MNADIQFVDFKKPDNKLSENPTSRPSPSLPIIIQTLGGGKGSNTPTPKK